MATPKKKTSKSKQGTRRSHDRLSPPTFSECPDCGEMKRPHVACSFCGFYKGNEVIKVDVA